MDLVAGTVQTVWCGLTRCAGNTDGLWPPVELDTHVYRLSDFPSTSEAVRRGSAFYVDTLTGDDNERRVLTQTGFQSMVAAGGMTKDDGAWRVEVYGDSLTTDLNSSMETLTTATKAALAQT